MPKYELIVSVKGTAERRILRRELDNDEQVNGAFDHKLYELESFHSWDSANSEKVFGMKIQDENSGKSIARMLYTVALTFVVLFACGATGAGNFGLAVLLWFLVGLMSIPFIGMFVQAANGIWK